MSNQMVKEWTLMFYFASDNPLAPSVVSQLKSIKQAGFHPEANVIAQFDPRTPGTPTHIFDVNLINKLKSKGRHDIGFAGNDPFVRNMVEDKLWRDQMARDSELVRDRLQQSLAAQGLDYNPPIPPRGKITNGSNGNGAAGNGTHGNGTHGQSAQHASPNGAHSDANDDELLDPKTSLDNFLKFCVASYPARHYMLFILGHGQVVGNDIFLFDEHAGESHSLTLIELGEVLTNFKRKVELQDSRFELLGLHSCSVSSLEVAYELQGTASYLMASQGPAFVGSWPYRQILIRIFNDLVRQGENIRVKEMLVKIFYYCVHNSTDFLAAGYSSDLCLCNLESVGNINRALKRLSGALIDGLRAKNNSLVRDFILLAHWKSQSFWQENYTDLYDFCFCLSNRCEEYEADSEKMPYALRVIYEACGEVMKCLEKCGEGLLTEAEELNESLVVRAEFVGPAYQYTHGLSVYFPWSQPLQDTGILEQYRNYRFSETRWLEFLREYFDATMRDSHKLEVAHARAFKGEAPLPMPTPAEQLLEDIASLVYNSEGSLSSEGSLGNINTGKIGSSDPTGDECTCGSIKNFPHDTRAIQARKQQAPRQALPVSQGVVEQWTDFKRNF